MGDLAVETPAAQLPLHKKQLPSSIPNIDSLEGIGTDGSDEYSTLKKLQRHLEYALCIFPYEDISFTNARPLDISTYKRSTSKMSSGMLAAFLRLYYLTVITTNAL